MTSMALQVALLISDSIGDATAVAQNLITTPPTSILSVQMTAASSNISTPSTLQPPSTVVTIPQLCLGLSDIFVAFFLIILIFTTVFGNILVVLSVIMYKRMRTFTNILLSSLATADLCVGVFVMPLALIDLLYRHNWPFGIMLCRIWATVDVLLCTASILNLCIISLDRYMAITSPLKYSRTRSRSLALGLLSCAWGISFVVCSPPWFVREWGIFEMTADGSFVHHYNTTFTCVYSPSVPYRIYSALGSFYIPLTVMLSMYFKIFRVASEREKIMRQMLGTCRLSRRADKHQRNDILKNTNHNRNCKVAMYNSVTSDMNSCNMELIKKKQLTNHNHHEVSPESSTNSNVNNNGSTVTTTQQLPKPSSTPSIERESKSLVDLSEAAEKWPDHPKRKNTEGGITPLTRQQQRAMTPAPTPTARLQPATLANRAQNPTALYNQHYGQSGKSIRGSKEKIVYLRERKALKTIGIVVFGFICCWMPFFVMYLIEVFAVGLSNSYVFRLLNELFLWLGYSNSVLNPIIYTMYNGDFRRCFRDLLTFGCWQRHRRTMSVKKLHQSTMF